MCKDVFQEMRRWTDYDAPAPDVATAFRRTKDDLLAALGKVESQRFAKLKIQIDAVLDLADDLNWFVRGSLAIAAIDQPESARSVHRKVKRKPIQHIGRNKYRELVKQAELGNSEALTELCHLLNISDDQRNETLAVARASRAKLVDQLNGARLRQDAARLLDDIGADWSHGIPHPLVALAVEPVLLCQVVLWQIDLCNPKVVQLLPEAVAAKTETRESAVRHQNIAFDLLNAVRALPLASSPMNKRKRSK